MSGPPQKSYQVPGRSFGTLSGTNVLRVKNTVNAPGPTGHYDSSPGTAVPQLADLGRRAGSVQCTSPRVGRFHGFVPFAGFLLVR